MGLVHDWIGSRYSINGSEGYITAGSSVDIELTGNTSFVGEVSLLIFVSGLDEDGEFVGTTFFDQVRVLPVEKPTILGVDPVIFITMVVVNIAVMVIASCSLFRHKRS